MISSDARIMLVEDENIIALDIKKQLERLGYTVVAVVTTGEKAVPWAIEIKPDLILMDIRLRGPMDGVEAARKIGEHCEIPIVYLTAHADEHTLQRAKLTIPFGYLLKPVKAAELKSTVEMVLYKHKMELKLKESERRFATTLKSIGEAVVATDAAGRVTFMNAVAEQLTGWQLSEAADRSIEDVFAVIHEKSRIEIKNPIFEVLGDQQSFSEQQDVILVAAKKAAEIPIDIIATPVKDDQQKTTGAVLVFRDISERKQSELALRKSKARFHQAQKMEAVGRLAGGIAHDFNNLLTAIIGYGSILRDMTPSEDARIDDIEAILRASRRAAELTQKLLAFSRQQILQPMSLNLNDVIQEAVNMLRHLIGEDVALTVKLAEDLGQIKADPIQMEQVLMNLVINGRDAMPEGGTLHIETRNVFLNEAAVGSLNNLEPGAYVWLSVSDTGVGIDEEIQAKIFEPFFTTKEPGKGTGLGLSTVYGIVEQSGGQVQVHSRPNQGTTFQIYMPRVDEFVESSNIAANVPLLPGWETILIVEDEHLVREMLQQVLEANRYTVLAAADAAEAMMICQQYKEPIHLMLTDVVMPGIDGYHLAERLKAFRPNMRVVYMSGHTGDPVTLKELHEPNVILLRKPFSLESLVNTLRSVLEKVPET